MLLDIALIGARLTQAFIASLKSDGAQVKALAEAEGTKLATSLDVIATLLAEQQIDTEEADALVAIQKSATEAVFASLKGISQVAARRATHAALASIVGSVDAVIGVPLVATAIGLITPPVAPVATG